MTTTLIPYKENKLSLSIQETKKRSKRFVVFFFGGSKTRGRERFIEWQKKLYLHGFNSVSFDYSGIGHSTGNFKKSSLARRIDEGQQIVNFVLTKYGKDIEIYFCGGSMGSYVALGVLSKITSEVKKLILFCPAAYSTKAHNCKFDDRFTRELNKKNSWITSRSFKWIRKYQGQVLILVPEYDETVPREIPQTYLQNAVNSRLRRLVIVNNATHNLLDKDENNKIVREKIYDDSLKFLR